MSARHTELRMTRRTRLTVSSVACGLVGYALVAWGWQTAALMVMIIPLVLASLQRPILAVCATVLVGPMVGHVTLLSAGGLPDVTVARVLLLWTTIVVFSRQPGVLNRAHPESKMLIALNLTAGTLLALMLWSAMRATDPVQGLQVWLDQYLLPLVLLAVLASRRWSKSDLRILLMCVVVAATMWSVAAGIEWNRGVNPWAVGGVPPWREGVVVRPGGPFVNPAVLGTALGMSLMLLASGFIAPLRRFPLALVAVVLQSAALVLTLTRSSWLAVGVSLFLVLVLTGRVRATWRTVVGVAVPAVGVLYAVSAVGNTTISDRVVSEGPVYGRIIVYAAALEVVRRAPVFGIGMGRFGTVVGGMLGSVRDINASAGAGIMVPHNTILDVASQAGIPAAFALIGLFVVIWRVLRTASSALADRAYWVGGLGALVVYAINALTIDMRVTSYVSWLLFCIVGPLVGRALAGQPEESGEVHTA